VRRPCVVSPDIHEYEEADERDDPPDESVALLTVLVHLWVTHMGPVMCFPPLAAGVTHMGPCLVQCCP
jgi:hypothetical protein